MAPRKKIPKLTALAVVAALAAAPISGVARAEKEKGPPIIRDTEAEQLLREYTRKILRAAGLEKQNIHNAPLIEMLLGQTLIASDNKAYTEDAITILRAAVERETEAPIGYAQLAMAYGRKGDFAQADLASAQAAYLRGDNKTAREIAARAKTRFAVGSPGWIKADDIIAAKPLPGQTKD